MQSQQEIQQTVLDTEQMVINELKMISKTIYISDYSIELEAQLAALGERAKKLFPDELSYPLAQFHYEYGSLVLKKLETSVDIFGNLLKKHNQKQQELESQQDGDQHQLESQKINDVIIEEEKEQREDGGENTEVDSEKQENQENPDNQQSDEENEQEQVEQDLQNIWENLQTALKIQLQEVQKCESLDFQDKEYTKEVKNALSNTYLRTAELENWREQFDHSIELLTEGIKYREQIDNKDSSRILCEFYFVLANTYLYKMNCEDKAINYLIMAIQILENNLSNILHIPNNILKNWESIQLSDIQREHLKSSFLDNPESNDIKNILNTIYDKLEDTLLQKNDNVTLNEEKKRMKMLQQQEDQFSKPTISENKDAIVKNLGIFGKKRKPQDIKQIMQDKKDENINIQNTPQIEINDKNELVQKNEESQKKAKLD